MPSIRDVVRLLPWHTHGPTTMKKLLPSAALALVVSAFVSATSFAGHTFGLFYHHGCCNCGAKFCVRQYNAFSPVCSGTVFCDGCCPFGPSGCGYGGNGGCANGACGVPFMGNLGCGDGSCLGSLPPSEPAPNAPATTNANPIVSPEPMPAIPTSKAVGNRNIQNATFRSVGYTPAANTPAPVRMQPQMMAAPSYWGN